MAEHLHSELYASIATLDQLKRMYNMGVVDVVSFRRVSEALINDAREKLEELRRIGHDVLQFIRRERITEEFPEAAGMLSLSPGYSSDSSGTVYPEDYHNDIDLAVLDVANAHSSKVFMGLAELIVQVVRKLPQYRNITYNDVIEAVNRVAESGLIPGIRTLPGGVKVVGLRPVELSADQADVMGLAASRGYVTIEDVMLHLRWSQDHARQVLMSLVDAGIAVSEMRYSTGGRYYFPGLNSRDNKTMSTQNSQ